LDAAIEAAASENRQEELALVEPIPGRDGLRTVVVDGGLVTGSGYTPMIQLGRSLRKKLQGGQLASAECGVVIVRVDLFSFLSQGRLRTCLEAIAAFVHECLEDTASEVSAVLVYEKWRGTPEECF